jgi:O-glycosyl hydrolase
VSLAVLFLSPVSLRAANVTVNVDYTNQRQTVEGFGASATVGRQRSRCILRSEANTNSRSSLRLIEAWRWSKLGSRRQLSLRLQPGARSLRLESLGHQEWHEVASARECGVWCEQVFGFFVEPAGVDEGQQLMHNGGHVLPQDYANLAALKIQWLNNAKAQLGFEAQVESVQNEPDHRATYDSCEWTTSEMNSFVVNHLKPALAVSGLSSRLMAPEASFYSNFDNAWGFPLLNDAGMRAAVSIVATHGYGRTDKFDTPCASCNQFNKPVWQTEDSNLDGKYNGSIDEGLTWSTEIYKALNGGRFSAWFYWWVMTLQNDNQGLLNVNPATDSVIVPKRLYVVGHFSRFIRPGSIVLGSTSTDSTLQVTAVKPVSGNVAVVLANTGRNSHTVP